jgi:hypothetical protein
MPYAFPHKKNNPLFNFDLHDGYFVVPGVPLPVPGKAMHLGVAALAAPWLRAGTLKGNGDKLLENGTPIISRGHEVKYCIVTHVNLVPFPPTSPNLLIPLLIGASSSKCLFSNPRVRGKDGPLALSILLYVGVNQGCNDPANFPTSRVINWSHVKVGWTTGDLLAWAFMVAWDAGTSFAVNKVFRRLTNAGKGWLPSLGKRLPQGLKRRMANAYQEFVPRWTPKGKETPIFLAVETLQKAIFNEVFGGQVGSDVGDKIKQRVDDPTGKEAVNLAFDPLGWPGEKMGEALGRWFDSRSEALPTK